MASRLPSDSHSDAISGGGSLVAELSVGRHRLPELDARDPEGRDFAARLLAALARMALRSWRRQADLGVALWRERLQASPAVLRSTLAELEERGFIKSVIPLEDGGVLLTVTSAGIQQLADSATSPGRRQRVE
jgi:hypothetical protein